MKGSLFKIAISGILIFFLLPVNTLKAAPVVAEQVRQELSLKDYAFFMVDQTSSIGIEQAGSSLQLHKYTKLSDGIPLTATGTLWVRFSLVNGSSAVSGGSIKANSDILLRLQKGTPPANMFVPQEISRNGEVFRWLKVLPNAEGDFVLPDPRNLPMTVYLKFSGTPGLWFNPVLHDLKFQPSAIRGYLQLALQAILVFSMFLALARGISGKEEWRLWGCGLIGCVIIQAIFCSQSPVFGRMTIVDLPQFLTPGITLILVAHLGRHLLHKGKNKFFDFVLILFCLVGAIAALLPILPGFVWCAKLMPLYPLLLLPLLIPASGMLLRKGPGGLTFLLLCLLPLAGALAALLGLTMFLVQGTPDGVLFRHGASLALWGYAAAALVIAIGSPNLKAEQEDFFPLPETDNPTAGENINLHIEIQDAERVLPPLEVEELPLDLELKYNDLSPLKENGFPETNYTAVSAGQDDATQVFPQADTAWQNNQEVGGQGQSAFAENTAPQQEITGEEADAPLAEPEIPVVRVIEITDEDEDWNEFDEDETDLTGQAEILSEPEPEPVADTLDLSFSAEADYSEEANPDFDYSAEAPHPGMELQPQGGNILANLEHIKTQQSKAENISDDLENILYGLGMALNNLDSAAHGNALDLPSQPGQPNQPNYPRMQSIFNLSSLVRAAHAETAALAESKGIALSWFVSPNLPLLYKGDEDSLKHALGYMLKGTVEYAESGVIQLTVREAPDHEEGLVQFSLTDNTMNPQSARRPAKILSRAWELARASQGSFSIDFLPNRGTSINFALKLQPLQGEDNVWGSDKKAAGQIPETQPVSEDSFPDLSGIDLSKEEAAPIAEQQEPAKRQTSAEPDIDRIGVAVPGPELVVTPASIVDIADFDELDLDLQENPTESTGEISGAVAGPVRDTIIVADLAASGRRLIARRLGELPHFRLEARNAAEIVQGCTWGNVCLIIFDADMPENDIKNALLEVNANEAKAGRPPVPSLGLLSHISQSSRMRKVGCTECQVKTASREKFQDMVLRLAPAQRREETPLAEADAAIMTESPKAQADLQPKTLPKTLSDQTLDEQQQAPAQQDGPNLPDAQSGDLSDATAQAENRKKINTAKPDRSVPLLDLIVSTLDEEEEQDISALPNLEPLDPLDQATKLAEARAVARSAKKKLSIPDIMHNAVKEK